MVALQMLFATRRQKGEFHTTAFDIERVSFSRLGCRRSSCDGRQRILVGGGCLTNGDLRTRWLHLPDLVGSARDERVEWRNPARCVVEPARPGDLPSSPNIFSKYELRPCWVQRT